MKIKLRRFKRYLAEIQRLKADNVKLQNDLDNCREEAEDREDQLRSATKNLKRAVSYGDDYAIKRAIEKIKRLG